MEFRLSDSRRLNQYQTVSRQGGAHLQRTRSPAGEREGGRVWWIRLLIWGFINTIKYLYCTMRRYIILSYWIWYFLFLKKFPQYAFTRGSKWSLLENVGSHGSQLWNQRDFSLPMNTKVSCKIQNFVWKGLPKFSYAS